MDGAQAIAPWNDKEAGVTRSAPPRRVGIDDVAREAGVSPSTVSRVLNNQPSGVHISASTANRVRHAAARLRYQPNAAARSLCTTQTHTVGVIAHDLVQPLHRPALAGDLRLLPYPWLPHPGGQRRAQ